MARFKDSSGQEWELSLSTGMLAKLRTDAAFVLTKQQAATQLAGLMDDPELFGRVLWVMVERQANERKIEPESFAFGLDGDAIERATTAMMEAAIDFFQRAGVRQSAKAKLPAIFEKADREMNAEIERAMTEALNQPVGN